jgi:hypothetical protein
MEMIQNSLAEGLPEAIRRDQRQKGVPVIGRKQPTKEVGTVNMPDFLDLATKKSGELIRIYIRIPVYCCQFFIHFRNFDALAKSRDIGKLLFVLFDDSAMLRP